MPVGPCARQRAGEWRSPAQATSAPGTRSQTAEPGNGGSHNPLVAVAKPCSTRPVQGVQRTSLAEEDLPGPGGRRTEEDRG